MFYRVEMSPAIPLFFMSTKNLRHTETQENLSNQSQTSKTQEQNFFLCQWLEELN
jgi:hypothetical protein